MSRFTGLRRQQFRKYFQPSRLVLCVMPAPTTQSGFTVITLSFNMYCSYKPPMMAIAVEKVNESYELVQRAEEFVLAVPGETLARETLQCGVLSVRDTDKIHTLGLALEPSQTVSVPGLSAAIANIELAKRAQVVCGDHVLVVGEVLRFAVDQANSSKPLISLGPETDGFTVLETRGIHRIGIVGARTQDEPSSLP